MRAWLRRTFSRQDFGSDVVRILLGGAPSASGVSVNETTAVQVAAVKACVGVISEGLATLPMHLMRPDPTGRGALPATDHPLYRILHRAPNTWQTAFEWRELMAVHALLCGQAFSLITRNARGEVKELLPIPPNVVTVEQATDWTISYTVRWPKGGTDRFGQRDMLVLRGPGWDGVTAWRPVQLLREAIGLAKAAELHGARTFGNGGMPSGVLEFPGAIDANRAKDIGEKWRENYGGDNTGKVAILTNGAKFTALSLNATETQMIETRKWQVEDIARGFRVFPHMIGAGQQATTYASAESFFAAHVAYTLMPWMVRLEQAVERDLFNDADRAAGLQAKLSAQALLRGNARDRAAFYGAAIKDGWMTRNEARGYEDLNPLDGLDEPLQPLNMAPAGDEPEPAPTDAPREPGSPTEAPNA
jgi:HK97 family phage portal protein